jgi:hypothetical protein
MEHKIRRRFVGKVGAIKLAIVEKVVKIWDVCVIYKLNIAFEKQA